MGVEVGGVKVIKELRHNLSLICCSMRSGNCSHYISPSVHNIFFSLFSY